MWAWIFDGREPLARQASGWSGTMSLPRVLTLGDDGLLRMKPIEELVALRYNERHMAETTIEAGAEVTVREVIGDTLELTIRLLPGRAQECGVKVCRSPDGSEQTRVYYDAGDGQLKIDTRQSSQWQGAKSVESGPFQLRPNEELVLSVFVDRSVVEVFANGRQAVMRRIYPSRPDSLGVSLFANGGSARLLGLSAWDMMPSNPY
jgi:beta-fructofuranosidase